jgi:hypothetical protein
MLYLGIDQHAKQLTISLRKKEIVNFRECNPAAWAQVSLPDEQRIGKARKIGCRKARPNPVNFDIRITKRFQVREPKRDIRKSPRTRIF